MVEVKEDEDLEDLIAWQGGNAQAGNRLFNRHYDTVYRFFDRKVSGDVADLVQNTFLTCLKAVDRFQHKSKFKTFLFGIARNKLLEHLRAQKRPGNSPVDMSVTSLADLGVSPTQLLRSQEQSRLVYEALRRIPLDHQLLIEMYYWEKMTGAELAGVFDCPENTVRARIRRARQLLRDAMAEVENDPTALDTTMSNLEDHMKRLREHGANPASSDGRAAQTGPNDEEH